MPSDFFKDTKKITLPKTEIKKVPEIQEQPEEIKETRHEEVRETRASERKTTQSSVVARTQKEEQVTQKSKERRGRKPNGEQAMERDFIAVNIGDGVRDDLSLLCKREEMFSKKTVGLGTYVRQLIEEDIQKNQDYLEKARALFANK